MTSSWSQNGNSVVEQNTGVTRNYGTKQDMGITATGNINKTPGLGLTQGGADYDAKYATYLKLFSGEMIKAYESACIAKGTVQNRTLKNGKSLQFIYTGRMTADYHQHNLLGHWRITRAKDRSTRLMIISSHTSCVDELQ